jgi:hypothetical protein
MSSNGHFDYGKASHDTQRLLFNGALIDAGLGHYAISKEKWNAWRPHPNLLEAIRGFARRKNDRED